MKKPSFEPGSTKSEKPKVLLVGEGPNDIGRKGEPGGALVGFIHAVLLGPGEPVPNEDLPFVVAKIAYWTNLQIQKPTQKRRTFEQVLKLKPDGERARAALLMASIAGYDCVAILRDCERVENIGLGPLLRSAREVFAAAAPYEKTRPGLVVAAPSRCHETWLLADQKAVRAVLDDAAPYHFSTNPESRPHCDELKSHLSEHSDRLHCSSVDVRRQLAFRARPEVLSERCSRCYSPFKDDVDNELRPRCQVPEITPKK